MSHPLQQPRSSFEFFRYIAADDTSPPAILTTEVTDAAQDGPQRVPKAKRMAFDPSEVDFSTPLEPSITDHQLTSAERAVLEARENRPSSVNLDQMFNNSTPYFPRPSKREPVENEMPLLSGATYVGQPLYAQQPYGSQGGYGGFNPQLQPTYLTAYSPAVGYATFPYYTQMNPAPVNNYHELHRAAGDFKPVLDVSGGGGVRSMASAAPLSQLRCSGGRTLKGQDTTATAADKITTPTSTKHSPALEVDEDLHNFNSYFVEPFTFQHQHQQQQGETTAEQKPVLAQGALSHLPLSTSVGATPGAIPLYSCAASGTLPTMSAAGEVAQSYGYWTTPTAPTSQFPMVLVPAAPVVTRPSRKRASGGQSKGVIKKAVPMKASMHVNSRCSNCRTTETTLWRRSQSGEIECNSCNLYFRKNHKSRPLHMCGKTIMRRKRHNKAQLLDVEAGGRMKLEPEAETELQLPQSLAEQTATNDEALKTTSPLGDYYAYY